MAITKRDVEYVANLSRITLADAEKETFTEQLAAIVAYMEKLNEVDTEGIEPMMHATHEGNVFRDDSPGGMFAAEEALLNAPKGRDGFFKVPKVIE